MASLREFFVDRGFSPEVADTAARARREATCRVYDPPILHYLRWCVDPAQASLTQVAEFLDGLRTVRHRDKPLASRTIAGYRSAIAGVYRGFPDGSMVSSNADLSTLLKGIIVVAARPKTLTEMWDLTTVLNYLKIASTGHLYVKMPS